MGYVLARISRTMKGSSQEYMVEAVVENESSCDITGEDLSSKIGIKIKVNPSLTIGEEKIISPSIIENLGIVHKRPSTSFTKNSGENLKVKNNRIDLDKLLKEIKLMGDYLDSIVYEKIDDGVLFFQYKPEEAENIMGDCQKYSVNCRWCDIDLRVHKNSTSLKQSCRKNRLLLGNKICVCASELEELEFVPFSEEPPGDSPFVKCDENYLEEIKEAGIRAQEGYKKINSKLVAEKI